MDNLYDVCYSSMPSNKMFCNLKQELLRYTLSEAWSGMNWGDLMPAHGAFGTDFYDRSTSTIVGTMLWTEYRHVIKIGPKSALGSHEIPQFTPLQASDRV